MVARIVTESSKYQKPLRPPVHFPSLTIPAKTSNSVGKFKVGFFLRGGSWIWKRKGGLYLLRKSDVRRRGHVFGGLQSFGEALATLAVRHWRRWQLRSFVPKTGSSDKEASWSAPSVRPHPFGAFTLSLLSSSLPRAKISLISPYDLDYLSPRVPQPWVLFHLPALRLFSPPGAFLLHFHA